MEKIALIIPALNEERTISLLVKDALALLEKGIIHDVVVVDDHSTDSTASIARNLGAKVLARGNGDRGKGQSFLDGLEYCRKTGATILLMIDADSEGRLEERHISRMVAPLLDGKMAMSIHPQLNGDELVAPEFTGQRAIRVSALNFVFKNCNGGWRFRDACRGYGLEKTLNWFLAGRSIYLSEFKHDPLMFRQTGGNGENPGMFMDFLMTGMALGDRPRKARELRAQRRSAPVLPAPGEKNRNQGAFLKTLRRIL